MNKKVLCLPGDGIGPEVMNSALEVLAVLNEDFSQSIMIEQAVIGGSAIESEGKAISQETLACAKASDAVLLGAVGGYQWDDLPVDQRPESGLLALRKHLDLYANLRPALVHPDLVAASSLKAELVSGLDLLIVRELTGGVYFGKPRGIIEEQGERVGFNTYRYSESEIRRIAQVAFEAAMQRDRKLCSIDKANVLEVTRLWREVVTDMGQEYPDVALSHMYVDNAAMQLVRDPKQFDVIVTGNLFGDILSDQAAMLTGSIGLLPSASLNSGQQGVYEPCHGSAPDIAGKGLANPIAMLLSVAMMLRYSFEEVEAAQALENAVFKTLQAGFRTFDLDQHNFVTTEAMTAAIIQRLRPSS